VRILARKGLECRADDLFDQSLLPHWTNPAAKLADGHDVEVGGSRGEQADLDDGRLGVASGEVDRLLKRDAQLVEEG